MRTITIALLALLLTGCIQMQAPTRHIVQTLPSVDADYAVYAGCVRAVARLTYRSRAYQAWTPDRIAFYCAEVQQSFKIERLGTGESET